MINRRKLLSTKLDLGRTRTGVFGGVTSIPVYYLPAYFPHHDSEGIRGKGGQMEAKDTSGLQELGTVHCPTWA